MSKQITSRPSSLRQLFWELFWPFQTLSWRPVQVRDGTTELTFSLRLRSESKQIAVRWLIVSGGFLVAAGVASTVLLMLGCVSAVFAVVLFFVDWQTQTPTSDENKDERRGRLMADIHRLPRRQREKRECKFHYNKT